MVNFPQHPAGVGSCDKRKMLYIFLWFTVSNLVEDTYCATLTSGSQLAALTPDLSPTHLSKAAASSSVKNSVDFSHYGNPKYDGTSHRVIRAVPRTKTIGSSMESISKTGANRDYVVKIPLSLLRQREFYRLLRPLREENQVKYDINKRNTIIPMARYGRAEDDDVLDVESENGDFISKRHDTIIPMVRFGRAKKQQHASKSQSLLSHPRSRRSILGIGEYETKNAENYVPSEGSNGYDQQHDILADTSDIFTNLKRDTEDYETIIPYPRPGREVSDNGFPAYILPQIRYGRSVLLLSPPKTTEETTKQKPTHTFVLPYPRPGRSNTDFKHLKSKSEQQLILPYPRPGRSNFYESVAKKNNNNNNKGYMLPSARFGRSDMEPFFDSAEDSLDIEDGFLGLKFNPLFLKSEQKNLSENPGDKTALSSVFVIPYPRPGKKSNFQIRSENQRQNNGERGAADYVLPYPRPGKRSGNNNLEKANENPQVQNFILPYPRPGRSVENIDVDNEDELVPPGADYIESDDVPNQLRMKRSNTVVPYPRLGRSYSYFPYIRLAKSNSIVPYPRFGRSNSVVPYPRLGRSNSIVPYPRFGRSVSVVPYPRPGRADSVVPYPRPGRSEAVVPYPRPGRADSIVPYPRPGRSGAVVPYPRPGRSNSLVPYPRPGRTSVVPYPRPGRSGSVVPYPRPGRSGSVVPYPRPGRAGSVVPYPRPGRSDSVVPYPRLGRSNSVMAYPQLQSLYEETPNVGWKSDDAYDMLYNAESEYTNVKEEPENDNISNSRPDRSSLNQGYVLPHPRIGRSEQQERNVRETTDVDTVIPYPRLGRSQKEVTPSPNTVNSVHRLNKHMLKNVDDSIYLLPYPRPGRYSE